jgi:hypothetical protein
MKGSIHGGMAHRARFGEPTICGEKAPYPTNRTEYKRVVDDAARGGATVYPCVVCFGKAPEVDG